MRRSASAVLEKLDEPSVVDGVEKRTDVHIEHPVHLLRQQSDVERIQRVMLAASGSEAVGEAEEVGFVDGVQHVDRGPLDDLVFQHGHAERPLPPVGLRDVHPPNRLRSVRTPLSAAPRGPGDSSPAPARSAATSRHPRPEPRPSSTRGTPSAGARTSYTWCRSAVNRIFLSRLAACRTRSSALGASVRRCVRDAFCWRGFPLVQPPSLHRLLGRSPGVVRRLRWYYAAVRLPRAVHHRRAPVRLPDAARGSISRGRLQDLPVPAHGVSERAQGL